MVLEKEKVKKMEKEFDTKLQDEITKKLSTLEQIKQTNKDMEESLTKLEQDFKVCGRDNKSVKKWTLFFQQLKHLIFIT